MKSDISHQNIFEDYYLLKTSNSFRILNIGKPQVPYVKPLSVNETGAFIFEQLNAGENLEDIVAMLSSKCNVPQKSVREDVFSFAAKLKEFGVPVSIPLQ